MMHRFYLTENIWGIEFQVQESGITESQNIWGNLKPGLSERRDSFGLISLPPLDLKKLKV